MIVRYADIVVGFKHEHDADVFLRSNRSDLQRIRYFIRRKRDWFASVVLQRSIAKSGDWENPRRLRFLVSSTSAGKRGTAAFNYNERLVRIACVRR